jgi:predicted AlkP superfamily phosphohydrolase/phosphomutase
MAKKTLVLCIDGATFRLLDPFMEDGYLPTIKRLKEEGTSGNLLSSVPPITAAAWSNLITGKNPGKHRISEFLIKKPGTYEEVVVNSTFRDSEAVWDILGENDVKVGVLNIPTTYPPTKVNGAMICGFLSLARKRDFVYPPGLLDEIEEKFGPYRVNLRPSFMNFYRSEKRVKTFIDDCISMLRYKFGTAKYLFDKYNFDVTFLHEWSGDRIQHELWDIIHPNDQHCDPKEKERYFPEVISYYQTLDQEIADILNHMGEDLSVLIVSDHGFGPLSKWVNLNVWLIQEGYLKIKKRLLSQLKHFLWKRGINYHNLLGPVLIGTILKFLFMIGLSPKKSPDADRIASFLTKRKRLFLSLDDVDWSQTKAYTKTGIGQIVINLKGREPQGLVNPGREFSELQSELVKKLKDLRDPETGKLVESDIYLKEEVYKGRYLEEMPDITYLPVNYNYSAVSALGGFASEHLFLQHKSHRSTHDMNGVLIAWGKHFKKKNWVKEAELTDIAPTLLYLMGIKIPPEMDGKVLTQLFQEDFLQNNKIEYSDRVPVPAEKYSPQISEGDDQEIRERLKGLGYLD